MTANSFSVNLFQARTSNGHQVWKPDLLNVARGTVLAVGSKLKRLKGLRKLGDDGQWMPGKISELIYDFARPLLDAMGPPRTIDDLRNAFMLATLCWNLPAFEKTGQPAAPRASTTIRGIAEERAGSARVASAPTGR
ncbi:MAG: hypothetical protein IPM35_41345 [Myxococcales bacterium]|nr:hypothetical protein [Myxococcales bacterium]